MTLPIRPTAVTMGDPAGIGGEITLKAWLNHGRDLVPFFVLDDPDRLQRLARALGLDVAIVAIDRAAEATDAFDRALPVLAMQLPRKPKPGCLDPENGPAVRASIEHAVALALEGEAGAVVTNPIHKLGLTKTGFEFPGHTEFLAALAGTKTEPVMMLAADMLRVVAVTRHVSVRDSLVLVTPALIDETARITSAALQRDFAIARPRLAISALNPHAGEGGIMGREEIDIIEPSISRLRSDGIDASGPFPADTLFHPEARRKYDAALCMYHDQALIPIKTIAFDSAVNVTLGIPFIRTSPDHGTALDIAGTGKADESSLVSALKMAATMSLNRAAWDAAHP